ncbi:MAG: hypothetical protein AB1486_15715 [Planctomycetota bacterium]
MNPVTTTEVRYKIPIFADESLVVTAGRFRTRLLICRGQSSTPLTVKGILHLGQRRPLVIHFIDRSLPSGGFRHDAIRIEWNEQGPSWERIEAPPPASLGRAERIEVSRLAARGEMKFIIQRR